MFRLHLYADSMQGETWTDERLDDLSRRMDQGFERVDRDLRDMRGEMRGEIRDVRGDVAELRVLIYRFGTGIIGAIAIAALLHGI
jgi:hypothetical protein